VNFLDILKTWYKTIYFLPVSFVFVFNPLSLVLSNLAKCAARQESDFPAFFVIYERELSIGFWEYPTFWYCCVSHKSRELLLKLFGLFCFYFSCVQNLTFFTRQMQIKRSEPLKMLFWKDCLL
jgi:hypothetical protein